MIRKSFNTGWMTGASTNGMSGLFGNKGITPVAITLPYDSLQDVQRTPDAPGAAQAGYYPPVNHGFSKVFDVPAEWEDKAVILEFEGVYTNSMVYINGDYAGGCLHGYSNFYVKANRFLKFGQSNEIRVTVATANDTRWYSGAGIYRNVKLLVSDLVHIVPDSYRVSTPEVDEDGATVLISMDIINEGHKVVTTSVTTTLTDAEGNVAGQREATVTAYPGQTETLRQRIYVEDVKRWNIETPYLYHASTRVVSGERVLDEERTHFGVRTLALDPKHGLRINGKTVKLRGACVHHDNGVIGSAAIDRAEERRVQLLKDAGFNAVRSAHYPISKSFLDACDRVGLVVMDEVSDMWTRCKNDSDFAHYFPHVWEEVCTRIVGKDFNHPSVVLYSIGNEIPETGSANGADIGRKIAEKIRSLDSTRYVLNSINTMLSVMDRLADMAKNASGEINDAMSSMGDQMEALAMSDLVTYATKESYDVLDLCGYNYAPGRYDLDKKLFPNRVLVGSETSPMRIASNWEIISRSTQAVGDFTWTGMDYIGEAGIGKMELKEDGAVPSFVGAFPWHLSRCGDIDITGQRRPMSFYRQIVFGLRTEPYIAVDYPKNYGKTPLPDMWSSFDALSSWSWEGSEGKTVRVNVFGVGDSFQLLLNGEEVGSGTLEQFRGTADISYRPGELTAVTYSGGAETGRTSLVSASGAVKIELIPDRAEIRANDSDLSYVEVNMTASNGVVVNTVNPTAKATVTGAGILLGFGSSEPKGTERFRAGEYTARDGRLLAVIRPTQPGTITLRVEAPGFETASVEIVAR